MVKKENLRIFIWIELAIWLIILSLSVFAIRNYRIKNTKLQSSYQIFLPDVDGLIVGSPVKFMGVEIGYIDRIRIVGNDVYVKFIITEKNIKLPKGVIATVEFYGLGGSKSLELYPPTQDSIASKKVVAVQPPKRLGAALELLSQMFEKIDSITQRASVFATETESIHPASDNALNYGEIKDNMDTLDSWINEINLKLPNKKNKAERLEKDDKQR
ncbi:MCE family protein [bacterium]|nr:MCE family protein [bacterium]